LPAEADAASLEVKPLPNEPSEHDAVLSQGKRYALHIGIHQERLFSDTDPGPAVNLAFRLDAGVVGQFKPLFQPL